MAKHEIQVEQDPTAQPEENIQLAIGAAINKHIAAKTLVEIDSMRQEATMKDLIALASTREGLATLVETQK